MQILNLTQHNATAQQINAGVFDLPEKHEIEQVQKDHVRSLLNFGEIPSQYDLEYAAAELAAVCECLRFHKYKFDYVMVGGAPFFMPFLEKALRNNGMKPIYAFSKRVSEEQEMPDGTVRKVNVFRHEGFVGMDFVDREVLHDDL